MKRYYWLLPLALLAACGSDDKTAETVSKNLTDGVNIPNAIKKEGPMPEGSSTSVSVTALTFYTPNDVSAQLSGPMVTPGGPISLPIKWAGGAIMAANIGFGGTGFLQVPAGTAGMQATGTLPVVGNLGSNVCDNLADTCHAIRCYEQVQLADGTTYSRQQLQQMVLDCSNGKGCNPGSNPGPGTGNGNVNVSSCPWVLGFTGGAGNNAFGNSACGQCLNSSCGPKYSACFGSGWQNGNLSGGSCGPYLQCLCACGQMDTNCFLNCAQSSGGQACGSCLQAQDIGSCYNNCAACN